MSGVLHLMSTADPESIVKTGGQPEESPETVVATLAGHQEEALALPDVLLWCVSRGHESAVAEHVGDDQCEHFARIVDRHFEEQQEPVVAVDLSHLGKDQQQVIERGKVWVLP